MRIRHPKLLWKTRLELSSSAIRMRAGSATMFAASLLFGGMPHGTNARRAAALITCQPCESIERRRLGKLEGEVKRLKRVKVDSELCAPA